MDVYKAEKSYKWIARDRDGELYRYDNPPLKDGLTDSWSGENPYPFNDDEGHFDYLKWTDKEPLRIEVTEVNTNIVKEHFKGLSYKPNSATQPSHYHTGSIDPIAFGEENFSQEEMKGFYRMNAIKYISRYDKKGTPMEDLEKAEFYIRKLKELIE